MPGQVPSSPPPGMLARLQARFGNPLDWTPVDRATFALALTLFYQVIYTASGLYFLSGDHLPYFIDRRGLEFTLRTFAPGMITSCTLLLAIGVAIRKSHPESRALQHAVLLSWWTFHCGELYMLGNFTTPFCHLLLLGGGFLSLLFAEVRIALPSFAWALVILLGTTWAVQQGLLPHAPMIADAVLLERSVSGQWLLIGGFLPLAFDLVLLWIVGAMIVRWRRRELEFKDLSITDALTGLPNRRRFAEQLAVECDRARRTGRPLSLLMCDADHFKKVNDTHGHAAGDQVLQNIGELLRGISRLGTDTPGRLGGEEFALLLAETDLDGALLVAARLLESARAARYEANGNAYRVTMSIGAACLTGEKANADILLELADTLLYRAKNKGRDRIESGGPEDLGK